MEHLEFSFVFLGLALYCVAMGILGGHIATTLVGHPNGIFMAATSTAVFTLAGGYFVAPFTRGLFRFFRGFLRGVLKGWRKGE